MLENFEDQGSSRVSRRLRPFENLLRPFENLSSQVSRLSSGTKDFSRDLALLEDLFWIQVHDISGQICLSENLLRSFSFFNLFYRNLSWMSKSFTK